MGYEAAIHKAWESLEACAQEKMASVRFLADEYALDVRGRTVASLSCNVPAKDFYAILILHYAAARCKGLPTLREEWRDFKEISGVEGYEAAFRTRCIAPLLRKYGKDPRALLGSINNPYMKKADMGDVGIIVEAFDRVPVLVTLWQGDDEFGPDANMLFDLSIKEIFCTEDVAVLGQILASQL